MAALQGSNSVPLLLLNHEREAWLSFFVSSHGKNKPIFSSLTLKIIFVIIPQKLQKPKQQDQIFQTERESEISRRATKDQQSSLNSHLEEPT